MKRFTVHPSKNNMTISEKRSFEKDHCRDVHFVNEKSRAKIGTGNSFHVPFFAPKTEILTRNIVSDVKKEYDAKHQWTVIAFGAPKHCHPVEPAPKCSCLGVLHEISHLGTDVRLRTKTR